MKRQKLLNKRILALVLSAAMVFAQADSYAVLAAAPEISGEEAEYDESQPVLTEDLETEEPETDLSDTSADGEGETPGGEGETTGGEGGTTGGEGETTGGEGETTGGEGETTGGEGETTGGEGETTGGEGETTGREGEDSGTKQTVFISEVTIANKGYNGQPVSYTGTLEVKDSAGNSITDVTTVCAYTGTLANGSEYTDVTKAPSQAGSYTLTVTISESDEYTAEAVSCSFEITRKAITITAPSQSIRTGQALPILSSLTATVEGLLEGDTLTTQPQLKYAADNISTKEEGTYDIIPFDADAGNNYSITYVNGALTIIKAQVVHEGGSKNKKLTWTIDDAGKLTVKGTGNYPMVEDEGYGMMPEWFQWGETIKSAEISVSGITTTERMFYNCALESIDFTNFDTSKVTNMSDMFNGCTNLTGLNLSSFNTSKVTNMSRMFSSCSSLTSLDLSSFDTSKVTNMSWMFYSCEKLISLDVSSFDTSKVVNMDSMFYWCESLTGLDVSSFNTSNVGNMDSMFGCCSELSSLDVSNFNTSKVTKMCYMFFECIMLESLDVSSFNTGRVTNMTEMFLNCSSLESLDLSGFDTSKVRSMARMFEGCSELTGLDLSNFNTSKLKFVHGMFFDCSSLTSVDLSSFDMGLVSADDGYEYFHDVSDTFKGCNSLSYIRTPKNCPEDIEIILPTGTSGKDKWYSDPDTQCTILPIGQSASIDLYKNGYPGDGKTKKAAFISGISMSNMVYNGKNVNYLGTAVVMDANKNKITDVTLNYSYSGTLAGGGKYAETTQAPSEAGSYKLLIKAENDNYSAQASYSFRIEPRTVVIRAESISIEKGADLPVLTDRYTVSGLLEGDALTAMPTLAYSENNIQTAFDGRYGIIPSGASVGSNYRIEYVEGTLTVGDPDDDSSFETDERKDLSSLSCTIATVRPKIYDGTAYEPALKVTVTENGKKKALAEGTDYRVLYEDNVNAGTGKVIVRGSGVYKGYKEASITINPKAVKKLKVVTGGVAGTISADAVNSGTTSLPVYVYDAGKLLTRDTDYTLTYDSVKKGTLTVKVTGKAGSNYTGEVKAKITVYEGASADKIINPENVTLKSYTEKYTGKAIKPAVEVNINGEVISNKNYKVQYQNNKNAGTAYVIVTGKGAYKGKVVTAFEITVNTQRLFITNTIKAQTYNGKLLKPAVTVTAGNKKLRKNTDYTVAYKNNLHAGTATITVTGKGNYTGTATKTFTINPLKAAKIAVKGTWKDTNADNIKDSGALTVTYGKRLLKEGVDYTLEEGEIKKNKIKITVKAPEGSDFTGSVIKTLKME